MAYTQFASKMAYDGGNPLRPKKRYSQDVLSAVADKNKPTSPMQPANIPGRPTPPRPRPERIYTQPPLAPALQAPQIGVQKPGLSLASDYMDAVPYTGPAMGPTPIPAAGPGQQPQPRPQPQPNQQAILDWIHKLQSVGATGPRIQDFGGYYPKTPADGMARPAVMPPPSWPSQEAEQAYNKAMAAWQSANSDKLSGIGGMFGGMGPMAPSPAPGPVLDGDAKWGPAPTPAPWSFNWQPAIDANVGWGRYGKTPVSELQKMSMGELATKIPIWLTDFNKRKGAGGQLLKDVLASIQSYQTQPAPAPSPAPSPQPAPAPSPQPAPAPGPIIGTPQPAPAPAPDPFPKMPDPWNPPSTIPATDPGQQYPWQQPPDVGGISGQGPTDDPMSRIAPGTTHPQIKETFGSRVPETYAEWMAMFPSPRNLAELQAAMPQLIDQQQQRALSISDRDRALATLQTLFPGQGGVGGGTTPAVGATPDTDAIVPGQGGGGAGASLQNLIESQMKSRLQGGQIPYVNEGQDQAALAAMLGARTGAPSQVGGEVAGQQDINSLLMGLSQGGFNVPTATSAGKGALESSLMESLQNPYSMTDEEFAKMKTGTREGIERETQQQLDAMRQGFRQRGIEGGLSEEAILRAMQSAEMGEQGALRDLDVQRAQERRGNIERAQQALGQYTGQDIAQQQAQTALGLQGAGQQAGVASNLASLLGQQRAQGVSEQLAGENIAQSRLGQYGDILGQYRGQEMQQVALNDEMIRANLGLAQGMRGQEAALSEGAADRNLRNALAQAQILAGTNRSPIDISSLIELYTGIQRATPPQRAESPSTLQQVFGGLGGIGQLIGGIGGLF